MSGAFDGQILVDKLARLNSSQQSIETLSHWCIFHMNKAKQVVETWDRQFHCSPREQRLAYLYLANDILQNSRRKGSEFVAEFWKVLPDALNDVIQNGDDFAKNAALRLVDIWDDRKVFGSRGKILKEGITGRSLEKANKNDKTSCLKVKQSVGNILEKIISSYEVVYDGPVDEEALLSKCRSAICDVDKADKKIGSDYSSGKLSGSELVELQRHHGVLRDYINQLRAAEISRLTLVSHLREALREQESKLEEVRNQLQAALSHSERAENTCQQLLKSRSGQLGEHRLNEPSTFSNMSSSSVQEPTQGGHEKEQSAPVVYTQRESLNQSSHIEDDPRKTTAAAVAAKLAASTDSAQMLTYVLSSLASEGIIGNRSNEPSGESPSGKRPKLEKDPNSYLPSPQHRPPLPPFPHPDSIQSKTTTKPVATQPPPPSSSPSLSHPNTTVQQSPQPVLQPPSMQYLQTTGARTSGVYNNGLTPQGPPTFTGYPMIGGVQQRGVPLNPYQGYHGPEGSFFTQPSMQALSPPMPRQ